jgi:phosphohistidine phosphatase
MVEGKFKMKLHLLRHAQPNNSSASGLDYDRELAREGYEQLEELKQFLTEHPIAPKTILCSSAVRTRQTLGAIEHLWPEAKIEFIDELYMAEKQEILTLICKLNSPDEILVVGHNLGISELVMNLARPAHALHTCGFVSIEFPSKAAPTFHKILGVFWGCFG